MGTPYLQVLLILMHKVTNDTKAVAKVLFCSFATVERITRVDFNYYEFPNNLLVPKPACHISKIKLAHYKI
jgi:hypothetical protein